MPRAGPLTSVKASVRETTYDKFRDFCREHGESQANLHGMLLEWFMSMDATTRTIILERLNSEDIQGATIIALAKKVPEADFNSAFQDLAEEHRQGIVAMARLLKNARVEAERSALAADDAAQASEQRSRKTRDSSG